MGGLVAFLAVAWSVPGGASPTDPVLTLTGARAVPGAATVVVQLDGSFPDQDLVQLAYPLQVLVRETTTGVGYVRYDLSGVVVEGSAPELADGLAAGEAPGLLVQGQPAPDAEVVLLGRGRIEVLLPVAFPAGPAEAQLFVVEDDGGVILSNPVPFTSGGAAP